MKQGQNRDRRLFEYRRKAGLPRLDFPKHPVQTRLLQRCCSRASSRAAFSYVFVAGRSFWTHRIRRGTNKCIWGRGIVVPERRGRRTRSSGLRRVTVRQRPVEHVDPVVTFIHSGGGGQRERWIVLVD